ncbi:MAG: 50S ribosomal protein L15 [Deltaproteobacteria bacterium]|nr:50S ribosomal protein L15 [Deltaproteobacteria bacterium]MCB9787350.1 50S ribosomal protein L15 [Deltaproteobacteria bacterium]
MNELSRLKPPAGARRDRKRVGRGPGSGNGTTAGRGQKGQKARAASKKPVGFEGGQMPLQRRLPKRGFKPRQRTRYSTVNIVDLNFFDAGTEVTPDLLAAEGFIRKPTDLVKILGDGELDVKVSVKAHKFTASAEEKVKAKGGTIEVIGG